MGTKWEAIVMKASTRRSALLLATLAFAICASGTSVTAQLVLLSASVPDAIAKFDGITGVELPPLVPTGNSTNLGEPNGVIIGPDGMLYVSSGQTDEVFRFDPVSGAFLGVFASGGGLNRPWDLAFGPDGNLYVSSSLTNSVLRFDGQTGTFLDVFATGVGAARRAHLGPRWKSLRFQYVAEPRDQV